MQNERAAKATVTIHRIGTIRSIFIFETCEHLRTAAGMMQYASGVMGRDARKEACASF